MSDRELLEKAAKAAEMRLVSYNHTTGACGYEDSGGRWWNPLTDDGDALRLAVKLGLRVGTDGQSVHPCIECWRPHYNFPRVAEPCGDDPYAATRRAIVRAAAEIGEATP